MNWKLEETKRVGRSDILFCVVPGDQPGSWYAGSSDGNLHRLRFDGEISETEPLLEKAHASYVTGLARTAQGQLVSGGYDRQLVWWDAASGKAVRTIPAHDKWIRDVVASPDGRIIASVADDMVCRLWKAEDGAPLGELRGHESMTPHDYPSMLFTCAFSPDGAVLATADKVGRIVVWDVASRQVARTLDAAVMYTWDPTQRRHSIGGIRSLAFSPDGKTLAAGGMGQVGNIDHLGGRMRVSLYRWESGETLKETESGELNGLAERMAFHPDGTWLLAQGGDNKGGTMLVDPVSGKVISEGTFAFHVHDFALAGPDAAFAVGHNGIALQTIAPV